MKNLLFIFVLFLPLYLYSEERESFCEIEGQKDLKGLKRELEEKNCQKGDIIGWITHNKNWSFTTMARVCDFKHQVKGTNEAGRGYEFCYYIGYIREER